MSNRPELIKQFYEAFSNVDRSDFVENLLAPSFTFSAPPDPLLNRDEFFDKCWPEGHNLKDNKYVRIIENADEVIVTHEYTKPDGLKGRNTVIHDTTSVFGNKQVYNHGSVNKNGDNYYMRIDKFPPIGQLGQTNINSTSANIEAAIEFNSPVNGGLIGITNGCIVENATAHGYTTIVDLPTQK